MIILLYVMDSLRPDFLSCYGYGKETSPNIDELARGGVVFMNAFAQATWTRPSGASLLSSLYPAVHGVLGLNSALSKDVSLLPERMQMNGFKTIAISSIGNISPSFGFGRGFDRFIELYKEEKVLKRRQGLDFDKMGWDRGHFNINTDYVALSTSEDINEYLFPFLEPAGKEDTFIFAWSLDTHDPYFHRDMTKAKFCAHDEMWSTKDVIDMHDERGLDRIRSLYEDMIYYNDHHIGSLIRRLKDLQLFDQSLIILTSDHGEAFGEHGFNGHGREPFDELIRVPLIIKFPHSQFVGRISALTQHIDIAPTLLEYMNMKSSDMLLQGKSVLPLLRGENQTNEFVLAEYQLSETQPRLTALRTEEYKYMELEAGKLTGKGILKELRQRFIWLLVKPVLLFCLENDPGEQINVVKGFGRVAKRLHSIKKIFARKARGLSSGIRKERRDNKLVDDEVKNQLKALGYFD